MGNRTCGHVGCILKQCKEKDWEASMHDSGATWAQMDVRRGSLKKEEETNGSGVVVNFRSGAARNRNAMMV